MIEYNINIRWEKGIPHHPESIKLLKSLSYIDSHYGNNFFDWKSGGDGDNGETFMYQADIHFEIQDRIKEI